MFEALHRDAEGERLVPGEVAVAVHAGAAQRNHEAQTVEQQEGDTRCADDRAGECLVSELVERLWENVRRVRAAFSGHVRRGASYTPGGCGRVARARTTERR